MNQTLLAYVFLFASSAVVCFGCIPRARTIQHPGTREGLVVFLASVGIWSSGYVGYLLAPTVPLKLASYVTGFVFAFVAVGAWLYFCAAYTGRPPRQTPFRTPIVAGFLFLVALKVTNPLHDLYFTTEWTASPFPHIAIQHQLLYWIVLGLSYAVIAVGFFMLFERFYFTGVDSRPLLGLVTLTGVPAVATILANQVDWVLPLMYEPPGVALFAVGILFVYKQRLETIRLTGDTDKPGIYLDQDSRIREFNRSAASLFPALDGSIGEPIVDVVPSFERPVEDQAVLSVPGDDGTRLYEVSRSSFRSGDVPTGQLVTFTDVTERESYRQRLEEKTEQLEALNRVVRHDIRNDMAVVIGWAEILEEHVDEGGEEPLQRVLQKSRHVIELTDIAHDFVESLTDAGSAELKPVDLRRVLTAELTAVRESYPDAAFQVDGAVPHVSVTANEMLSSVLRNLLENAVRHNDESRPAVTVSVTETDGTVRIRVADNGPGVPDEQKAQVFGKGEKRVDSPGSGIGLYLVNMLVDQFGGDVWIEDNDPKGSVFVVELTRTDGEAVVAETP